MLQVLTVEWGYNGDIVAFIGDEQPEHPDSTGWNGRHPAVRPTWSGEFSMRSVRISARSMGDLGGIIGIVLSVHLDCQVHIFVHLSN